ncbi:MAG: T9SS type A sorting domain-containing protein [Bacteroidetes bacterium]|nr:T9SS type A sorting domain-containing protein [Bacteroidota bacterium]
MRTICKSMFLLFFSVQAFTLLKSQPANLYYTFATQWGDSLMNDRGITNAVSIQSTATGTGAFLFNTAPGVYNPKWCGSNTGADYSRAVNQKIVGGAYYYTSGGWDHDFAFTVQTGYYYTFITGKNAATNNDMSILETAYNPVNILSVTQLPALIVAPSQAVTVSVNLSNTKNANENVFVRYTTDNWSTSAFLQVPTFNPNYHGVVDIPGQAGGTVVSYYAFTTEQTTPDASTIDYYTLKLNNNNNVNYSYTVSSPSTISWCNLQFPPNGSIIWGDSLTVYAQVYASGVTENSGQGAGIEAWIGYNPLNTDPSTWSTWEIASYNQDAGNNDEYYTSIKPLSPDTFFYASRFRINGGTYYYGGYNANGGGFWDGSSNISDTLIVGEYVGIYEISSHQILVYPNPATNLLSIKADFNNDNILTINNSLGQIMLSDIIKSGTSVKSYNVSNFPKGIYFINVKSNTCNITEPLIIK